MYRRTDGRCTGIGESLLKSTARAYSKSIRLYRYEEQQQSSPYRIVAGAWLGDDVLIGHWRVVCACMHFVEFRG